MLVCCYPCVIYYPINTILQVISKIRAYPRNSLPELSFDRVVVKSKPAPSFSKKTPSTQHTENRLEAIYVVIPKSTPAPSLSKKSPSSQRQRLLPARSRRQPNKPRTDSKWST